MFGKMIAFFLLLQALLVQGFWRMECPHRLGIARMDPLVSSGKVSAHAHAIYGSNGFSLDSEFDQLQGGTCSSCRVTLDKSAYWHPQLYFEDFDTGEFEQVEPMGGMLAYYFLHGENIQPFPEGFRMIAGDNNRRTWDLPWDMHGSDPDKSHWAENGINREDYRRQIAVGINCLNYDRAPEPTLNRHYLPDKAFIDQECKDGIRFELMFPSCWNGKDLDSPDHRSHVAYSDLVLDGGCHDPEFPVQLPGLMFEVFYQTPKYLERNGRFVGANGDTEALGYHGDFISGWKEDVLREAVDTCRNESGMIEDCGVFQPHLQSEAAAGQCSLQTPEILVHENVVGPIRNLPGGVKITYGPGGSDPALDISALGGQDPALPGGDGGAFKEGPAPAKAAAEDAANEPAEVLTPQPEPQPEPEPESITEPAPVVTEAVAPAADAVDAAEVEPEFFSTQYVTVGNVVSKILWVQEVVTSTQMADHTSTVTVKETSTVAAAGKLRRGLSHRHGHGQFAYQHRH